MDPQSVELFIKNYNYMLACARNLVGKFAPPSFNAEDVVQEAFVSMLKEGVSLQEERNPQSYLTQRIRFTYSKLIEQSKGKYRHSLQDEKSAAFVNHLEKEAWYRHLEDVEKGDLIHKLLLTWGKLTPQQQIIFEFYLNNLSNVEIGGRVRAARAEEKMAPRAKVKRGDKAYSTHVRLGQRRVEDMIAAVQRAYFKPHERPQTVKLPKRTTPRKGRKR